MPRETLDTPEMMQDILELVKDGCSVNAVAEILGVHRDSVMKWLDKHPDVKRRCRMARYYRNKNVEDALYSKAVGYQHSEEKIFFDAETGAVTRVSTTKHYPPDTKAAEFWLKNKASHTWQDTQKVEHSGQITSGVQVVVSLPSNGREIKASVVDSDSRLSLPESTSGLPASPEDEE